MGRSVHGREQGLQRLMSQGNETERTAIRVMQVDDAGCVYWAASALGKWAKLKGFATLLKHKDTAKAYITRVEELDANFLCGSDRYFGAVYAVAPSFAIGDLDKAEFASTSPSRSSPATSAQGTEGRLLRHQASRRGALRQAAR